MTADAGADGLESLYPFLYDTPPTGPERDDLLAHVRASTEEKLAEVDDLRATVTATYEAALLACADAVAARFTRGGRLLAFGNGGSSTDALALAAALCDPPHGRRPLPAVALSADVAVVTALANDVGVATVFARQIAAFGQPEDVALGLSTSGDSANVVDALAQAHRRGLLTIGFAGYDGGELARLDGLDFVFVVPSSSVHRVQEVQTTLYGILCDLVQQAIGVPA